MSYILYHGDCLNILPSIEDKSVDMILCDLPYGTVKLSWDVVIPFEPLWKEYKRVISNNGAIVLFGSQPFTSILINSNIKDFKYEWVWDKGQTGNPFLAKKQPLKTHENILVFGNPRYKPIMREGKMRKKGGAKQSQVFGVTDSVINNQYYPISILSVSNCSNKKDKVHPTQKPVDLLEYLISTYTDEGQTVLDNCMGSASTGVACLKTNRKFIGMEKDIRYFSIGCLRMEQNKTW